MKTNSNNPYTYSSNGTSVYPITADYSNGTNVNRDNVISGTCITSDSSNGTCGYPIT